MPGRAGFSFVAGLPERSLTTDDDAVCNNAHNCDYAVVAQAVARPDVLSLRSSSDGFSVQASVRRTGYGDRNAALAVRSTAGFSEQLFCKMQCVSGTGSQWRRISFISCLIAVF